MDNFALNPKKIIEHLRAGAEIANQVAYLRDEFRNQLDGNYLFALENWKELCRAGVISEEEVWQSIEDFESKQSIDKENIVIEARIDYLQYYAEKYQNKLSQILTYINGLDVLNLPEDIQEKIKKLVSTIFSMNNPQSVRASYEFIENLLNTQLETSEIWSFYMNSIESIMYAPGTAKKYELLVRLSGLYAQSEENPFESILEDLSEVEEDFVPTAISDDEARRILEKYNNEPYRSVGNSRTETLMNLVYSGYGAGVVAYLKTFNDDLLGSMFIAEMELIKMLVDAGYKEEVHSFVDRLMPMGKLNPDKVIHELKKIVIDEICAQFSSLNINIPEETYTGLVNSLGYAELKFLGLILGKHGVLSPELKSFLSREIETIELAKTGSGMDIGLREIKNRISAEAGSYWKVLNDLGIPVGQFLNMNPTEYENEVEVVSPYGGVAVGDYLNMLMVSDRHFEFNSANFMIARMNSLEMDIAKPIERLQLYYGGKDELLEILLEQVLNIANAVKEQGIALTNMNINNFVFQLVDAEYYKNHMAKFGNINTLPINTEHITDDFRRWNETYSNGKRKFVPVVRLIDLDELMDKQELQSVPAKLSAAA